MSNSQGGQQYGQPKMGNQRFGGGGMGLPNQPGVLQGQDTAFRNAYGGGMPQGVANSANQMYQQKPDDGLDYMPGSSIGTARRADGGLGAGNMGGMPQGRDFNPMPPMGVSDYDGTGGIDPMVRMPQGRDLDAMPPQAGMASQQFDYGYNPGDQGYQGPGAQFSPPPQLAPQQPPPGYLNEKLGAGTNVMRRPGMPGQMGLMDPAADMYGQRGYQRG